MEEKSESSKDDGQVLGRRRAFAEQRVGAVSVVDLDGALQLLDELVLAAK